MKTAERLRCNHSSTEGSFGAKTRAFISAKSVWKHDFFALIRFAISQWLGLDAPLEVMEQYIGADRSPQ